MQIVDSILQGPNRVGLRHLWISFSGKYRFFQTRELEAPATIGTRSSFP